MQKKKTRHTDTRTHITKGESGAFTIAVCRCISALSGVVRVFLFRSVDIAYAIMAEPTTLRHSFLFAVWR